MSKPRVLIIEDERGLTQALDYNLRREGYDVASSADGSEGLRKARTLLPDVVILELMLPGMNGLDVCKELRAGDKTREIPVLMLTARAEETDQVVGFSVGADDYVTKPFSTKVLMQRVKALQRRNESSNDVAEFVEHLGVKIDRVRHRVTIEDDDLELTPTEFRLLECLL